MNRTKRFIGLIVAFSLVAYLAIGYADVASAGRVAVCAPAQAVPAVCQPAQPVLPLRPCATGPTGARSLRARRTSCVAQPLGRRRAPSACHFGRSTTSTLRRGCASSAVAGGCQPAKIVPLPPVCQPVCPRLRCANRRCRRLRPANRRSRSVRCITFFITTLSTPTRPSSR